MGAPGDGEIAQVIYGNFGNYVILAICGFTLKGPHILSNVRARKRYQICKPNSVRRCRRDGHSSRPFIAEWLKRPTRRFCAPSRHACAFAQLPPYLVLLRVGFALPRALLRERCALTAPFHPYLSLTAKAVCSLLH